MILRFMSDGTTYVIGHRLQGRRVNGSTILPLLVSDLDLESVDVPYRTRSEIVARSGNEEYRGILLRDTAGTLTMIDNDNKTIYVRNYDVAETSSLLEVMGSPGELSYITRAIQGEMLYGLDTDTGTINVYLSIINNGLVPINGAKVEISLSQRTIARAMAYDSAPSTGLSTYHVPGRYDADDGYRTLSLVDKITPNIEYQHVIDLTNGRSQSTYVARWRSPVTLPSGRMTVYSSGSPLTQTSMGNVVPGMDVTVDMMTTPMVYALTTINDTDDSIRIQGTVYNASDEDEMVMLRYWVGDRPVTRVQKDGGYALIEMRVNANSNNKVNMTI